MEKEEYILESENEYIEYLFRHRAVLYNYINKNIRTNIKSGKRKFKIRRIPIYIDASKLIKKFNKHKLKKTINRVFGYKTNFNYKQVEEATILLDIEKHFLEGYNKKYSIEIGKKYYKFKRIKNINNNKENILF